MEQDHDEDIHVIEFKAPREVHLEKVSPGCLTNHTQPSVLVHTKFTAVSPGTELLVYKGTMPGDMSLDANIGAFQSSFEYPCRYGYCAAGVVAESFGTDGFQPGTKVFAFREHVSAFRALPSDLHRIPDCVSLANASLIPTFETAVSLIMDANPLPGEFVCVIGQGLVGLSVTACLRKLYPYNRVVAIEPREARRDLSRTGAQAHFALPSWKEVKALFGGNQGADVTIEVSGVGGGLDAALCVTRDYGRIVLGSWFGTETVTLNNLGAQFHRSHISIVASQVSHVPASIAPRWSKHRRFELAWKLLADVSPVESFNLPFYTPYKCSEVYFGLAKGQVISAIFDWQR